jgi:uncharacterized metal-binding protein
MPSGRTHDSITLWSLPLIAGLTFNCTQSGNLTLTVAGGYLFSGLMFGPDLDIYSRQYLRWGFLRWIWLPYRKVMRHRSVLSHGPMLGTIGRIIYLLVWVALFGLGMVLLGAIAARLVDRNEEWQLWLHQVSSASTYWIDQSLKQHPGEWLALFIGLELGSLSHSFSDWAEVAYKRLTPKSVPRSKPIRPNPEPIFSREEPAQTEASDSNVQLPSLPNTLNAFYPPSSSPTSPPSHQRPIDLPNFKRPRRN